MNEPATKTEAYIAEILDEILPLKNIIKQAHDNMDIRIGITQEIIDSHLSQAKLALAQHTQTVNQQSITIEKDLAHAKNELAHFTNSYLKTAVTQSLLDAHHALQLKPIRLNKQTVLSIILIASLTTGVIGGTIGTAVHYWSVKPLTPQQEQAIAQGQRLSQVWPHLDSQTQSALNKAFNAQ